MNKEQRESLRALAENAGDNTIFTDYTKMKTVLPELLDLVDRYEKALENIADLDLSFYRDGFSALSMGQIAREALEGGSGK